jgi:hypothetical protein
VRQQATRITDGDTTAQQFLPLRIVFFVFHSLPDSLRSSLLANARIPVNVLALCTTSIAHDFQASSRSQSFHHRSDTFVNLESSTLVTTTYNSKRIPRLLSLTANVMLAEAHSSDRIMLAHFFAAASFRALIDKIVRTSRAYRNSLNLARDCRQMSLVVLSIKEQDKHFRLSN